MSAEEKPRGSPLLARLRRATMAWKRAPAEPRPEAPRSVAASRFSQDFLKQRLDVPFLATAPERNLRGEIENGFAGLADSGSWPSLLDRLRGLDLSRQQLPSGKRLFECALAGALAPVTRHLGPEPDIAAALEAAERIAEVAAAHPRDYMPAAIQSRALTAIGQALRGDGRVFGGPEAMAQAARESYAAAEAAIERFDPIEENSPILAEARYRLAPGVEGGLGFLRDWYEDWADLDPSNPQMLMTHSGLLMPGRYGDLDEIERESRRAVARAADGLGNGAYVFFWITPLAEDPALLARIDAGLFVAGIRETLAVTMSQHLANSFAALLWRLSRPLRDGAAEAAESTAESRAILRDGFADILRQSLREVHQPLWEMETREIRAVIAEVFEAELSAGETIGPTESGLGPVEPEPLG